MFESLTEKLGSALRNLRGVGKLTEENMAGALQEVRTALRKAQDLEDERKKLLARLLGPHWDDTPEAEPDPVPLNFGDPTIVNVGFSVLTVPPLADGCHHPPDASILSTTVPVKTG